MGLTFYNDKTRYIFTAAPGDEQIALNEIRLADAGSRVVALPGGGVGLMETEMRYGDFICAVKQKPPVFIRHFAPVDFSADVTDIEHCVETLRPMLDKTKAVAVQARVLGKDPPPHAYAAGKFLRCALVADGFTFDDASPELIVSAAVFGNASHIGVSRPADNLSVWAGGRIRFPDDANRISRAELKLLEAESVFGLVFKAGGRALDLGASPGGWSRVLAGRGMYVTAVDPAELHPSLLNDRRVTHVRATAGEYLRSDPRERFDVIANDMKMDADASADIIVAAKPLLSDGGFCVMTLKLAERNMQRGAARVINHLSSHYAVAGARRLYHNRNEATVVLR